MSRERIYNFDCETAEEATGAILVYAIYRSRNQNKFKVSTDMWGQIERFVKGAAKRSENLQRFVDRLRPKLHCDTLNPRYLSGMAIENKPLEIDGGFIEFDGEGQRSFLSDYINGVDHKKVLDLLYNETTYIVMLVRERLENERKLNM